MKSLEECERMIIDLKVQIEEAKRIEEKVRIQLKEKEKNSERLESTIVSLRKKLEKTITKLNKSLKFEKSTKILNNVINEQRSPPIKTRLGHEAKKDQVSKEPSKNTNEENPKSYVDALKSPIKGGGNKKKENCAPQKYGTPPKFNN